VAEKHRECAALDHRHFSMRGKRITQNILSNWMALAVSTAVGFFLAPYIVHRLGNVAYGVWVLVASLSAYMGLLDFGLRGAVMRYVSKGNAQGNHAEAQEAVSAALWIRLWISLAVFLAGAVFAQIFPRLFAVPAAMEHAARMAILLTAVTVSLNLWSGVFAGVLTALHRYDQLSLITMFQSTCRAAGFVWLLHNGHGFLALVLWELCISFLSNSMLVITAQRSYPQLRLTLRRPSNEVFHKLWTYSFYALLINLAIQVVNYTDNLVVGAFTSAAAVTLYAIGGSLIMYARQIVGAMTTTFAPLASTYEAQGSQKDLRSLLIQGTRAALVVSLPIEVALFLRGETFISLWMGPQYAHPSGTVLRILLLSLIVSTGSAASGGIVYGMEKHKRIAKWAVVEAVANLGLSIFLVRRIGIYGVAWGTAIPSLVIEVIYWPPYICHLVGMGVRFYLWQTWGRTVLAAVPYGVACYFVERYWPVQNLIFFFLQVAILLPLFPLVLALVYRAELIQFLRKRFPNWARFQLNSDRDEIQSSLTPLP
jgi:O-antigen/teichoic acid export membrane protein